MGLFGKKELTQEHIEKIKYLANLSFDSISGKTAEISFEPSSIALHDCDGNSIRFEAEEVPRRSGSLNGILCTYGKAKDAVLRYMKENRYRFVKSSDENVFRNFNYEDCREFPIEKY